MLVEASAFEPPMREMAVRRSLARSIVRAWVITLPMAALMGDLCLGLSQLFK